VTAMLFEVSAADVASTSDDYYTPRWIFNAAGLTFDLDVSAPVDPIRRTCPARRYLTPLEDGLTQPWDGLVWMNPPYSKPGPWVERFAAHHCGLGLVRAAHRAHWMGTLMNCADAITLLSVNFIGGADSTPFLLLMAACGEAAVGAVAKVAAADKYIGGAYHVRPGTWC